MSTPLHILLISERFPYTNNGDFRGGVEARTYFSAKALAEKFTVTVLAAAEAGKVQEPIPGFHIIRCGPPRPREAGSVLWYRLRFFFAALQAAKRIPANVVEGTSHLTYEIAMRVAKAKRIPAFCTYHDLWIGEWHRNFGRIRGFFGELVERRMLRYPWAQIIAVSTVTRAKLIEHGVAPGRIVVIPNGVPTDHLPEAQVRYDRPTVVYVGRLVRYKRIEDILEAAVRVRETIPNFSVRIIGAGPERAALEARVRELSLQDHVVFHGFIPKLSDVLEIVAKSHALCLPSTVEGFGLVTIEAMAVGTPYVASDIPPTVEVTQNGIGGILYPPGSVEDLAHGLRAILGDDAYGQQLGEAGKNFVLEKYHWGLIGEQLREVYQNVG